MQWVNEEALEQLLAFAADNPYASFYKDKYARAKVMPTRENFFILPTLSRRELTDTPVAARTYVPKNEVRFVAFTSGTSSRVPLITPFADVENYFVEPSLGQSITRPLIIYPPLNKNFGASFIQQCRQATQPVSPMFGDFQNLANSALVAYEMQCDAIYATPTIASLFVEHAKAQGIVHNIKLLALSSETLTAARRRELASAYPDARIANLYASSEIGQFAMIPCPHMIEHSIEAFHVLTPALAAVEVIDGELVVSYGLNRAMPLVRYRTGDYVEAAETCPCGLPGPTLRWSHRDSDRVRLNGMEFTVDETDRVMGELPHLPVPSYQVHFMPGEGSAVVIKVEIADAALAARADEARAVEETLARELPDHWRLSGQATLRHALERGLVAGFTVAVVPDVSERGGKLKRLVNHVR